MRDVVVICTRNRAADLRDALNSVLRQQRLPTALLVVDSSDTDESERVVAELNAATTSSILIEHQYAPRGLTIQRNHGLRKVQGYYDVVHFIDDDVVLERSYTSELLAVFERDGGVVGAGGRMEGVGRPEHWRTMRLVGRADHRPGVVLKTGVNVGASQSEVPCCVQWLPGCSMSFRLAAIEGLNFDEARAGYAMGEDVDFGLKAHRRGTLVHVPSAELNHKLSPVNRHTRRDLEMMAAQNRWKLAEDHPDVVRKDAVLASAIALALIRLTFAGATFKRDRMVAATAELSAIRAYIRNGGLGV